MGKDKIVGIFKILGILINEFYCYVDFVYGDDFKGNDVGIFFFVNRFFVIVNKKNLDVFIFVNMICIFWENIFSNYF